MNKIQKGVCLSVAIGTLTTQALKITSTNTQIEPTFVETESEIWSTQADEDAMNEVSSAAVATLATKSVNMS